MWPCVNGSIITNQISGQRKRMKSTGVTRPFENIWVGMFGPFLLLNSDSLEGPNRPPQRLLKISKRFSGGACTTPHHNKEWNRCLHSPPLIYNPPLFHLTVFLCF